MHTRIHINNATLVNEGRTFVGSLVIEDDTIAEIIEGTAAPSVPGDETVDATGCYLLPGVIDTHVHFRDPGLTDKADMESESRAAAAGGVTTFFDMPNTLPQTVTPEAVEEKTAYAYRHSHVNFGFFIGATNSNATQLARINPRRVCGIKVFMGASTGDMLVDKAAALRDIFEGARVPVVTHCEDSALIAKNLEAFKAQYGPDPDVRFHSAIRSEEACYKSTAQAVRLALETGARLHVAHVSTARELKLLRRHAGRFTAEACLPHLLFCEADYAELGARIKCNPAVKTAADRDALRHALTDGTIRTVATDHAPHRLSQKQGGCVRAASGIPMVQFSLPAMLDLVDEGVLPVERLVELMCHNPATLFDIENRGFLREGYKADLVLVRPRSLWTLPPCRIESKCGWSPLEGHTFRWRVEKTYCNGFLIYNGGRITDTDFHGQAVTYNR